MDLVPFHEAALGAFRGDFRLFEDVHRGLFAVGRDVHAAFAVDRDRDGLRLTREDGGSGLAEEVAAAVELLEPAFEREEVVVVWIGDVDVAVGFVDRDRVAQFGEAEFVGRFALEAGAWPAAEEAGGRFDRLDAGPAGVTRGRRADLVAGRFVHVSAELEDRRSVFGELLDPVVEVVREVDGAVAAG